MIPSVLVSRGHDTLCINTLSDDIVSYPSQLEAAAASSRILQVSEQRPKKTKKKRKYTPPAGSTGRMTRPVSRRSGCAPKQHFKLKIGEIPFIGGTVGGWFIAFTSFFSLCGRQCRLRALRFS